MGKDTLLALVTREGEEIAYGYAQEDASLMHFVAHRSGTAHAIFIKEFEDGRQVVQLLRKLPTPIAMQQDDSVDLSLAGS